MSFSPSGVPFRQPSEQGQREHSSVVWAYSALRSKKGCPSTLLWKDGLGHVSDERKAIVGVPGLIHQHRKSGLTNIK